MTIQFEEKKFDIPALQGISAKTIEEHLKLYAGYVKHANLVLKMVESFSPMVLGDNPPPEGVYGLAEARRRFAFEYGGMRNHEVYFGSLEGGATPLAQGALMTKIEETWGSFDSWLAHFKAMALGTRGIGWAVLWFDKKNNVLMNGWMDEQHLGILQGCEMILGLDMWEHSYVADYQPSGKKQYVEDFFANLNWAQVEANFANASGA
jgi:Fe-Mn family superoxide dismutase